ncbi:phenylacetate--CoA ligase [Desulfuromonas versatilis]|uniref:Phenylacetate--CoA ligase n=1 Tax=Desulfuromonas versatilis TaxID=2802975 RepID=A0ABM9SDE3_9BACT|nr:AMP-binding protein [Desulfuromonas versatilis]BCR03184.1 phenylacetate--CoA ligase [Desulfuromonas versatilis]
MIPAGADREFRDSGLAFRPGEEIAAAQEALLRRHLSYLARHSPFYRERFAAAGVDPAQIRTLADLAALPLTGKDDLAARSADFLCVDQREIVDLCLTSGTTGRPVALPQTARDLARVGYNEELSFRAAGLGEGDRVLIAAAMDRCFMAGLAYFIGLTRLGCLAIRGGSSSIPALAELVRDHRPTAMVGVPTLLLRLAEHLRSEGIDPAGLAVQRLICIGEPVRRADLALSVLGVRLRESWGAAVYGTYASTEMATAFSDCAAGRGGHLAPELIVVEILDEQGRVLPPGQPGEVVATPLQVSGMPLLRFRTGDIAVLHDEPCPCGRNTWRLGPVLGRRAQMLKYRGTTLFPPAIFGVLEELEGVRGYYLEVFDEFELSDRVRVVVGSADPSVKAEAVAARIAARIRVKPEVLVVSPEQVLRKTLQQDKRKPVTFFDYRGTDRKGQDDHV